MQNYQNTKLYKTEHHDEFEIQQLKNFILLRIQQNQTIEIDYINKIILSFSQGYDFLDQNQKHKIQDNPEHLFAKYDTIDSIQQGLVEIQQSKIAIRFQDSEFVWNIIEDYLRLLKQIFQIQDLVQEDLKNKVSNLVSQINDTKELKIMNTQIQTQIENQNILDEQYWKYLQIQLQKKIILIQLQKFFNQCRNIDKTKKTNKETQKNYIFQQKDSKKLNLNFKIKVEQQQDYQCQSKKVEDFENFCIQINQDIFKQLSIQKLSSTFSLHQAKEKIEQNNKELQQDEINRYKELSKTYLWVDNMKSQQPHYFIKVKMGYEWNTYNKVHYSLDNPPPKSVIGYRFSIFYFNKFDKHDTPQYFLQNMTDPNYVQITFKGGLPYENLSFIIRNKKWNMSDRKSFKCNFENNIFHLFFDFEKSVYKR